MKRNTKIITTTLLAGSAILAHSAEVTEAQRKKIEPQLAGAYNPMAFYDGKLVFDVQERVRGELRENNFDFSSDVDGPTDDAFLLQRLRLGALVKPVRWFKAYVQGQDSREFESKRKNVPFVGGSEGDDPLDLRQAFVELGNSADFPLIAKVGRQELIYGDERLVGAFDWNNFSRTFDAVKLRYDKPAQKFWVDAFAAHVVEIRRFGPSENRGWTFNDANWQDTLAGVYGSTTWIPKQTTDLYFLYRNKKDNDPVYQDDLGNRARPYDIAQEVYTLGARVKSLPGTLSGFDYEAEGAYQFGRAQGRIGPDYPNMAGADLDHSAFAFEARAGYTFEDLGWKPRIGVEYSLASGDTDPNDDKNDAFMNLFPTNHKFYGYMDLFAWKNIHNPSVSLKLAPHEKVTVQFDMHAFWLYTNEDAWYRANAVATVRSLNRDANTFVGSEFDLTIAWNPVPYLRLLAGYSHFFAGDYLLDTAVLPLGDDDADFGYLQAMLTF
jgi:hypothetical protein